MSRHITRSNHFDLCVLLCSEVLIEKHWRVVTPRSVCDYFWDEACKYSSKEVQGTPHIHASLQKTPS